MQAEFGGRFLKLFRGPMFSGAQPEHMGNPVHARLNVAAVGCSTINKRAEDSVYTKEPTLQVLY